MALPSFSHVWSSRQPDSTSSKDDRFFLLGSSTGTGSAAQTVPVFRRNLNTQWFDQSYSFSPFSCCDKPFDTEEKLQEHKRAHVKCYTPDCEFTAHPDMIEKHFELQHHNNLYRKVCLTNRPEDVAKWITDRKRNFPTKTRVQTRVHEEQRRRDRGQVIEKKEFGLMRGGRGNRRPRGGHFRPTNFRGRPGVFRARGVGRGRGGFGRGGRFPQQKFETPSGKLEEPMACLDKEDEAESESDGDDRPVEMSSKRAPVGLSLIADYDSSSSSGEEMAEEKAPPTPETDPRPPPDAQTVADLRRRDPVLRLMRRRENCMEDKRRLLSRPRLLEMLLARDIRHERNVLMQCCFFIANRNFFGQCPRVGDPRRDDSSSSAASARSLTGQNPRDEEDWDVDGIL